jgi:hypothetical protein
MTTLIFFLNTITVTFFLFFYFFLLFVRILVLANSVSKMLAKLTVGYVLAYSIKAAYQHAKKKKKIIFFNSFKSDEINEVEYFNKTKTSTSSM